MSETKTCRTCGDTKSIDQFYACGRGARRADCKRCYPTVRGAARAAERPEQTTWVYLVESSDRTVRKYGITSSLDNRMAQLRDLPLCFNRIVEAHPCRNRAVAETWESHFAHSLPTKDRVADRRGCHTGHTEFFRRTRRSSRLTLEGCRPKFVAARIDL